MPLKLVIFDLDGTLVDTRLDIANALNYAVEPLGMGPLSLEAVTGLIGEGLSRLVEKTLGEKYAAHKGEVLERFLKHYDTHVADNSRPYPYVRHLLGALKTRKAVLSNKRKALSVKLLDILRLADSFDLIAGSDTTPAKKPHPGAVEYVLKALGAAPHEAAVIGDSVYDIEAGRAAGVRTVAVTYGYMGREALTGADIIIDRLEELIPRLYEDGGLIDRRSETRHTVPSIFQQYIEFKVRIADEYSPASLLDFSEHGLQMRCPVPFDPGSTRQCTIAVPKSLDRVIPMTIRIVHVAEQDGAFVVGARIEEVGSGLWFKVFKNILSFIAERKDVIY